tara:strand:- start:601 stop:1980 length:1380 start_codon:yes stop_codon:yes gene_type:complete
MNLDELKKKGYNIVTNWQECNKKSIYLFNNTNTTKFLNYTKLAYKKNCKFIICNIKFKNQIEQNSIKYFYYKNKKDLEIIAKIFYNLNKLKIVFITGTNGKTSIAYGANKLFSDNKIKSCYIGTLGFFINSKKIKKLNNTTPSYFEILNLLQIASNYDVKFVFIEVSSIGYSEGRIGNLKYNYCVLTNLKSDHLDYHKNLKNYHLAKYNLIRNHRLKNSILFIQDNKLKNKFKNFDDKLIIQGNYSSEKEISVIQKNFCKFEISTKNQSYYINSLNDYMVRNIVTILMVYNKIIKKFPLKFNKSIFPPGRSEIIYNKKNKIIIIDYAHSKDAYENLLNKLPLLKKKIIIIYGCGGDRDKVKRPQIARVVSKYSNLQIITDDNPRNEDPVAIRKALIKYSSNPIEIPNRREAIKYGVNYIKKNDGILIIAGKGHEDTQNYKDKYYLLNDREISSKYAKNL